MADLRPLADTPEPPYYAVIFTSVRREHNGDDGYGDVAARMYELAQTMPGYLGFEVARGDGVGLGVSYWESKEAIANWKQQGEHLVAQGRGMNEWYEAFRLRVAKVERERVWER